MAAVHGFSRLGTGASPRAKRRGLGVVVGVASTAVEAIAVRRLGYPVAGNVVVRCRAGHLFTTLWVPGGSVKSIRLGWWRLQRCPVGRHWSFVTPVRRTDLSRGQRLLADRRKDIRIP
jgi:hypothetical protein